MTQDLSHAPPAPSLPETFPVNLSSTTELLERFHRTLMDRRQPLDWDAFDVSQYSPELVSHARLQWAGRAVAEYHSTAQFGQLLHRLTRIGAPVNLIGPATRLAQDECRHAELCARMADLLGGRATQDVPLAGTALYDEEPDPWLQVYRSVLSVCCFGEALSIPMLRALELVSTDPLPRALARIIAGDEEVHARYGWELLTWLTPQLDEARFAFIESRLPLLMAHFERICAGSADMLDRLAGMDVDISEGDPAEPNLGTLSDEQYAAIFYHTLETELLPNLDALGFDGLGAWQRRPALLDG